MFNTDQYYGIVGRYAMDVLNPKKKDEPKLNWRMTSNRISTGHRDRLNGDERINPWVLYGDKCLTGSLVPASLARLVPAFGELIWFGPVQYFGWLLPAYPIEDGWFMTCWAGKPGKPKKSGRIISPWGHINEEFADMEKHHKTITDGIKKPRNTKYGVIVAPDLNLMPPPPTEDKEVEEDLDEVDFGEEEYVEEEYVEEVPPPSKKQKKNTPVAFAGFVPAGFVPAVQIARPIATPIQATVVPESQQYEVMSAAAASLQNISNGVFDGLGSFQMPTVGGMDNWAENVLNIPDTPVRTAPAPPPPAPVEEPEEESEEEVEEEPEVHTPPPPIPGKCPTQHAMKQLCEHEEELYDERTWEEMQSDNFWEDIVETEYETDAEEEEDLLA